MAKPTAMSCVGLAKQAEEGFVGGGWDDCVDLQELICVSLYGDAEEEVLWFGIRVRLKVLCIVSCVIRRSFTR